MTNMGSTYKWDGGKNPFPFHIYNGRIYMKVNNTADFSNVNLNQDEINFALTNHLVADSTVTLIQVNISDTVTRASTILLPGFDLDSYTYINKKYLTFPGANNANTSAAAIWINKLNEYNNYANDLSIQVCLTDQEREDYSVEDLTAFRNAPSTSANYSERVNLNVPKLFGDINEKGMKNTVKLTQIDYAEGYWLKRDFGNTWYSIYPGEPYYVESGGDYSMMPYWQFPGFNARACWQKAFRPQEMSLTATDVNSILVTNNSSALGDNKLYTLSFSNANPITYCENKNVLLEAGTNVCPQDDWAYEGFVPHAQIDEGTYYIVDETQEPVYLGFNRNDLLGTTIDNTMAVKRNNGFIYIPEDAPFDYMSYEIGTIVDGTWVKKRLVENMIYNKYTDDELSGFHYLGDGWNCLASPYGYIQNITSQNANHNVYLEGTQHTTGNAVEGLFPNNDLPYIPIFETFGQGISVSDSLGNVLVSPTENWRTLLTKFNQFVVGGHPEGEYLVTSRDRNAYPDNDYVDRVHYLKLVELTKFIEYTYSREELLDVYLETDRYTYPHEIQGEIDDSYNDTVVGANEELIPDAEWISYEGAYLGDSIPLLGIVEDVIPPSEILGVPAYDKQVNTSDTLKYGTVASASLTFNLNMPVDDAMAYNNELLVLFYDFEHTGVYENFGFFYIDSIEVLDEYTSHLTAHDEVYKLNKYADDFLITQTSQTTLLGFYHALLDYCNCCYDSHETIGNATFALDNIYNATKTTGIEVAHFVANIAPGFIHANAEGDVVLQEYKAKPTILTNSDYTDLKYNAYNTDILDKVRIVNNNTILGEDSGTGEKIYYIKDNPLIKVLTPQETINTLSNDILARYKAIPIYRPATVHFLVKPDAETGDVITVVSQTNQAYNIAIMRVSINESGLEMESLGTATFPVEADSNAQLSNLSNNIDEIHTDITDIGDNITDINEAIDTLNDNDIALDNAIDAIGTRLTNVEDATSLNTNFRNTFGTNNSVSTTQTLGTVKINGNSVNNFAMKGYVDNSAADTLDTAKSYSDTNLQTAKNYTDNTFANVPIVSRRNINYVCTGEFSGTHCDAWFLRFGTYGGIMYTLDSKHYIFTRDYVEGTGMGGEYWFYGDKTVWVTFNDD